jgi:hypothetical protein
MKARNRVKSEMPQRFVEVPRFFVSVSTNGTMAEWLLRET